MGQDGHPTREEWIGRIREAATLDEVIDLGSEGLGAMRERWGDDFGAVRALRRLWQSASFLAGVPEEGLKNKEGQLLLDRDRAKEAGLLAAKEFAVALIAPMGSEDPIGAASAAVGRARDGAAKAFAEAAGKKTFGHDAEMTDCAIGAWARIQSFFFKEVEIASRDWFDWEDLRARPNGGNGPRAGSKSGLEESASTEISEKEIDVLDRNFRKTEPLADADEMARRFGFRGVRLGAMGSEISRKSARALADAFGDLGKKAGIPSQAIGLGGLELCVGMDLGIKAGHHNPISKELSFGARPGFVGHEWTHALEHFAEKANSPELTSALKDLREGIRDLRQDGDSAKGLLSTLRSEAEAELRETAGMLASFAKAKGKEDFARWAIGPGTNKHGEPDPSEELQEKWRGVICRGTRSSGGLIPREREEAMRLAREMVQKAWDPEKPSPNWEALEEMTDGALMRLRWASEAEKMAVSGKSAFEIFASLQDRKESEWIQRGIKAGYWSSEKEMLARAAESFFHDPDSPALAYVEAEDYSSPQGKERASLEGKFQKLMRAAARELGREEAMEAQAESAAPILAAASPAEVAARLRQRRGDPEIAQRRDLSL